MKTAGSNVLFAAVTEISDSVLKGAEASGFNGMVFSSLNMLVFWVHWKIRIDIYIINIHNLGFTWFFQGEWLSPWNTEISYGAIPTGYCFVGRWPR